MSDIRNRINADGSTFAVGGGTVTNQIKAAWAVEYVENGKRVIALDSARHSTPEEAKRALEDSTGIPWKELERRGAKVVQQEIPVIPSLPGQS